MAASLTRGSTAVRALAPSSLRLASSLSSACFVRHASNVPSEPPKSRAQSILNALPGSNIASKSAIASAGIGVSLYAVSNEILVINEETVVAFSLLSIFYAVAKYGGPMYKEWADGQVTKMRGILNSARQNHTSAVKDRIEKVQQLGSVVDVTKQLFEVSKETAKLEAQAFELEQRTNVAKEAKAVLDSWVRYEGQVKQRQQKELAETVIARVNKELENPKTMQNILQQSVADVERIMASKG